MERRSKLKLPMVLLPVIIVFIRKEVKPVQTVLPQSLRGQEDLHTGLYDHRVQFSYFCEMHQFRFIRYLGLQILQLPIISVANLPLVWFRAKLDDNARLLDFTQKLEAACIGAVEYGKMTKDLALLVHGSAKYVTAVSVLLLHSSASSACVHSLIFY